MIRFAKSASLASRQALPDDGCQLQQDGGVLLSVVESKTQARLAELTLKGPVGGVVVYKRVMKLAGLSEPEDEDAVLVQIQQPIFM